jgi:hypothetical protein
MVDYCDICGYMLEVEIVETETDDGNSVTQSTVCEACKEVFM